MNRRDALKNLGLSFGYVVATPTILNMLQSCTTSDAKWRPLFFSDKQANVIENLVDHILPNTEGVPGALEVNVPQFIDLYISETATDEEKKIFKTGIDAIMDELGGPKEEPFHLEKEKYEALLSKYLRTTKDERLAYAEQEDIIFLTLTNLRDQAAWAFRTSEEIGKNILVYDPIPGQQKGCISVEDATGGQAWTL